MSEMDKGWSWVVLSACCVVYGMSVGMPWSMGIYFVPLREYFASSQQQTALALSIGFSVYCFGAVPSGILYKLFGCRILVILSAVISATGFLLSFFTTNIVQFTLTQALTGLAFSLTNPAILAVQAEYFTKYRSLSLSLVTVGCPVGLFLFPPLFTLFIDWFGWRGSMLLNAGLALQMAVCGALVRPHTITIRPPINIKNLYPLSMFSNIRCWLVWAMVFSMRGLTSVYFTFINAYLLEKGVERHVAAFIVSVSGITNLTGRIIGSFMAQYFHISKKRIILLGTMSLLVLQPLMTSFGTNEVYFGSVLGLLGLADGLNTATIMVYMLEEFGKDLFPHVQGMNGLTAGTAILVLPQLAGALADRFNLTVSMYFGSVVGSIAVICVSLLAVLGILEDKKKGMKEKESDEEENDEKIS